VKTLVVVLMLISFVSPSRAEFLLGVGTHVHTNELQQTLGILKASHVNTFRQDLDWNYVETQKNKYELRSTTMWKYIQTASGISPVLILDYGNKFYDNNGKPVSKEAIEAFARYAQFTVKETLGKVQIFEVWNEWENGAEPKSPESYFKLFKSAAPVIKAANKNAIVLAGSATTKGWIETLVGSGILKYADGISIHPYIHCERDKSPEAWLKFVSETASRAQKANGGKPVPLYITEMGWPSNNGACGISSDAAAKYLGQALLLVRTLPEVKGFWWYDLKNDGGDASDMEHNYGLLNLDFSPKPAFAAFRDVAPYVINARTVARLPAPNGVVALMLTDPSGKKSFALWSENGTDIRVHLNVTRLVNTLPAIIQIGSGSLVKGVFNSDKIENIVKLDATPRIISGVGNVRVSRVE
jgi:polysaccharide biosynthesis protein PslG